MSRTISVVATAFVAIALLISQAQPAAAHERRDVGPYQLVVGWLTEPAYVGQPNSLDLRVTDPRVTPAKPIEGLEKTLTLQIFYGGLTTPFTPTVTARFGTPGAYNGYVQPTRDGTYKFVLKGKIESTDVNETFTSGPTTFGDILPLTRLQYPEAVPAGAEVTDKLNGIQSSLDQIRVVALAAVALAVFAVARSLRSPRV